MAENFVTIVGNVTRDVELRYTPSGNAVANFGVAVNRRWQNRQTNEWEEQTSFFDVKAWSQLGENADASINKGDRVIVSGRLEQRSWETDQGDKRSKVEIVADEVSLSLKWLKVTGVEKNERPDSAGSGRGSNQSSGGRRQSGGGGRSNSAPDEGVYDDEEPF